MLFTALVAACAMTACGTKTTETAAEEEVAREVGSSDIAYVQVEAVLAQCDLFLNEGAALQEKTQKAQKSWAQKEQNLQAEAAQLQEKYQKGLITTNDAQAQQQLKHRNDNLNRFHVHSPPTLESKGGSPPKNPLHR